MRWRIAGVSAGLTLVILLGFALIVGKLASDRLKNDFEEDLQSAANSIATQSFPPKERLDALMTGEGFVSFVDAEGDRLPNSPAAPAFGPPVTDKVTTRGDFTVAATRANPNTVAAQPYFVQYAETRDDLEATIGRLWLFLGVGVLAGTVLATLAGLAVANRAMRPIAGLTAAAREITMTRDPSVRLPEPETDDEVAELARTLTQMLHELDAARAEREQMIQSQRDFVADASHELRTPLTSVLANLELLEARLAQRGDDAESEEIVAGALGSSRRMRRLVSDLLLLARADAGRAGARRECDLATIADAALAEVRAVAGDHVVNAELTRPVPVEGNPDDLHRMAVNLLENAVRHTPRGTTIELSVIRRDGEAVLEVSDDGPGLPDGAGEQIFARFVRGDGAPADLAHDSGTGLGLAIVKAVAVAQGGDVEASESPAGGARFTVHLPLSHHPQPDAPQPATAG